MRRVILGDTGIETSALGFGCASLGTRTDAAEGRRALAAAFDAGVTWLDLAPVYGGGQAEAIAAPFLRAHRGAVQVCTKAGLALAGGGLRRRLLPIASRALALAGPATARGLKESLKAAAPKANAKPPLTPALIACSLESSLRTLGTDHVDLFALHAPDPAEVGRDDILRALEAVLAAGKARSVAVAGSAAAAAAALGAGAPYGVLQVALPEAEAGTAAGVPLLAAAATRRFGTVVHSVLGARGGGGGGSGGLAPGEADRRLARAFAANPGGVVLVSMLSERSRAATLAAARAALV